jgi:hypothetical protein
MGQILNSLKQRTTGRILTLMCALKMGFIRCGIMASTEI